MASKVGKTTVEKRSDIDDVSKFLHRFDEEELSISRRRTENEIKDIADAVRETVETLCFKAFENNPVFHIPREDVDKHVISVGSFTEGTKVDDVDEFDFTFVYPYFSGYDNVYISLSEKGPDCKQNMGMLETWAYFDAFYNGPSNTYLTEFLMPRVSFPGQKISPKTLRHYFFSKIAHFCEQNPNFTVVKQSGKLTIRPIKTDYVHDITSFTFKRPAMLLSMEWQGTESQLYINVDLAPVIKCPYASLRLPLPYALSTAADHTGYCYMLPVSAKFDIAFEISFVQTENNIMRALLPTNETWIMCYKLFKYLSKDIHSVDSYIIKSFIIREALVKRKQVNRGFVECFVMLKGYIQSMKDEHTCHGMMFRSLWFNDHPIKCIDNTESTVQDEIDELNRRYERVIELLRNIEISSYDYDCARYILLAVFNRPL